jgi:AcrR family transcriptional regulator
MSTTDQRAGKPGRKRAFKPRLPGQERRSLVLSVALAAFAETGYELASMGTIATAAGVTRPVLYHYFPSKPALYLAVLDEQSAAMSTFIAQSVSRQPDYAHRIFTAAEAYLGFAEQHPQAWALLLDDSAMTDPECAAGRRRVHDTLMQSSLALFAPDIATTGRDVTDPAVELGMKFVLSGFNGVIQWWRDHPDMTRHQVLAALTELISNLAALTTQANERE